MLQSSGPRHFLVLGTGFVEDNFSMDWEVGGWFCEIQAHYIYCALYFYFVAAAASKSLQSCPTVRPHRRQPTRLPRPWDSPGKNTGGGCHFLLQCMKVKSEREVAQSCLTPTQQL